jgi:NAD(P)-dependent dehydrogenase (short-subunit alcohol dehydrogenase family)
VTVNAVLPGPTLTEGVERMLQGQADQEGKTIDEVGVQFVKAKRPSSILQRLASPREVASMVVYICSEQASATTGAALRVDGGTIDSII